MASNAATQRDAGLWLNTGLACCDFSYSLGAVGRDVDIILPATATVEREDIGASDRNHPVVAMERLIELVGEGRNECGILTEIVWHSDHPSPEKFPLKSEVAHHATP
ncbi:hypothetical protein [Rhizobium skierniewicense]|uniref:hypothetical protein n=1 Tax=Rhizobium skierniewicense TaxID=984260 RepID=UPI001574AB13|nr:hypothetical protein [Rhizobium skierniewicense]NTF33884.1 hypothetical protein [Rhizobium skierniewicense]